MDESTGLVMFDVWLGMGEPCRDYDWKDVFVLFMKAPELMFLSIGVFSVGSEMLAQR